VSRDDDRGLWDSCAQPERTALAWSRTALSNAALLAGLSRQLSLPEAGQRPPPGAGATPRTFGVQQSGNVEHGLVVAYGSVAV
jgi:hypothetical protein